MSRQESAAACLPAPAALAVEERRRAFERIVTEHERAVYNLIYRTVGDPEEAADLTQETFLNAYRFFEQFRGEAKVFTWLYRIAHNLCINRVRSRSVRRAVQAVSLEGNLEDGRSSPRELPDSRFAPQTVLERRELQEQILAAVAALPATYKEVVLLREFRGLTYAEIAEATGLSLDNVKTRLSRGRAALRRALEPYLSA